MSELLYHTQCPQCVSRGSDRSQDNLGVYSDHKWCFSCGYYEGEKQEFYKPEQVMETKQHDVNSLPIDFDLSNIRLDALTWLKSYGITNAEITANYIGWSKSKEFLIFPVYGEDGWLVMWQGRYFGHQNFPKYHTKGSKDVFHVLGMEHSSIVVLVEDIVSAIKVSRVCKCMPLWGSEITRQQGNVLSKDFEQIVLWLDPDKKKECLKFKIWLELFFDKVSIIYSEKDPKYYDDDTIATYVRLA